MTFIKSCYLPVVFAKGSDFATVRSPKEHQKFILRMFRVVNPKG